MDGISLEATNRQNHGEPTVRGEKWRSKCYLPRMCKFVICLRRRLQIYLLVTLNISLTNFNSLGFKKISGESLLMAMKDVALSSGSACTSASLEPSYVLRAIGTDEDLAHSSIRFGLGRFTTVEEVDYTAEKCIKHVQRLREMRFVCLQRGRRYFFYLFFFLNDKTITLSKRFSPLWEMHQEGIDLKSIKWTQH